MPEIMDINESDILYFFIHTYKNLLHKWGKNNKKKETITNNRIGQL